MLKKTSAAFFNNFFARCFGDFDVGEGPHVARGDGVLEPVHDRQGDDQGHGAQEDVGLRAVVRSAEAGDADAVDLLIELLDDADRGVRMYSILALERLCGENYGYSYYAPEAERAAAIARWRAARQHNQVSVRRQPIRRTGPGVTATHVQEESEEPSP